MATVTLEQRTKRFGERRCVICQAPYVPWYAPQEACKRACAVALGWRRGGFKNRDRSAQVRGGRKGAQTKRLRAIAKIAAALGGGPVTDRDLALYKLGWKHCTETNNGRWLLNKAKAKGRQRRRAA